ncbi:hypothetical protein SK128_013704 [Halocaridina rubra]|uniref:Neurotransmitter-gated ion-channel transmembrane domain-containing protein n=1 Tax=Halocaridina rubra TaxID=373956 RepID=A0AAN9AD01_HALRR
MYAGDGALIVQQQHYSGSFVCVFGVFDYPFDRQRCNILVQLSAISKELVSFTANKSTAVYLQNPELPTYLVGDFSATLPANQTRLSIIEVGFTLTRRYTLIVLNVYLPSLMLMVIGYATLYVKVDQLEIRSSVSLTTLLVLYTFFNQTSSSLPQTAYVKLIDVWFFFCTSFLFAIIVTHVFVEKLDNNAVTPFDAREKEGNNFALMTVLTRSFASAEKCLMVIRNVIGPIVLFIFFAVYILILLA